MATDGDVGRIRVSPRSRAPLSEDQRYELQSLLLKYDKVKPLDTALREACLSAGWQTRIEERVLEMLHNGEAKNIQQLERQVIAEALGKNKSDQDKEAEQNKTSDSARGLEVPREAVRAGTKVVREVLEKSVDVKVEQVEDKEWRDWR